LICEEVGRNSCFTKKALEDHVRTNRTEDLALIMTMPGLAGLTTPGRVSRIAPSLRKIGITLPGVKDEVSGGGASKSSVTIPTNSSSC